ncbi:MAG: MFS transporter [Legionellales bacterium]|nr:MFS transporter [Legionellales bacterium]
MTTSIYSYKLKILPWIMWGFGALFYCYEFFVQISPNVMSADLMRDFSIQADKLGILVGIFAYAYALIQIPAGVLLDKLGPCKLLAAASLILALGCLTFSKATGFYCALLGRLCIGAGAASAVVGCMKIATNWFPLNKFALVLGLTISIGMSGAIIGSAPLAIMMEHYHWRHLIFNFSIIGFIFSIIFIFICRNSPNKTNNKSLTDSSDVITFKKLFVGLKIAISKPQVWIVAIYGLLMFGPSISFCGLWGVPFLQTKYGLEPHDAAKLTSLVFIGWIIGSPLWGHLSDLIKKRLPTMKYGSILASVIIGIIIYMPNLSMFQLGFLLTIFGLVSSGFLTAFSIIREISPQHCTASVLSFMNTMNSLGPALLQPLVGILLTFFWSGKIAENGVPYYSIEEYHFSLGILPLSLFIAFCMTPFIQETHCEIVNQ